MHTRKSCKKCSCFILQIAWYSTDTTLPVISCKSLQLIFPSLKAPARHFNENIFSGDFKIHSSIFRLYSHIVSEAQLVLKQSHSSKLSKDMVYKQVTIWCFNIGCNLSYMAFQLELNKLHFLMLSCTFNSNILYLFHLLPL